MIAKRLAIMLFLERGARFSTIKKTLHVSQQTIVRVQSDRKQGRLAFVASRAKEYENDSSFLDALEMLLRAGMPPIVGRGRWRYLDELAGAPKWRRRK